MSPVSNVSRGQKRARVNFLPGRSIADYNQLFTATSLMPSHVIADQLGLDVTSALQGGDLAEIGRVAEAWNTTWDLKPGMDAEALKRFPSRPVPNRFGAGLRRGGADRK